MCGSRRVLVISCQLGLQLTSTVFFKTFAPPSGRCLNVVYFTKLATKDVVSYKSDVGLKRRRTPTIDRDGILQCVVRRR